MWNWFLIGFCAAIGLTGFQDKSGHRFSLAEYIFILIIGTLLGYATLFLFMLELTSQIVELRLTKKDK